MGVAAIVAGSVAVAGASTYSVINSNKAKNDAESAANNEESSIASLEDQQAQQQQQTEKQQAQAAGQAQQQAQSAANSTQRRGSMLAGTIMTTPLGAVSAPQTAGKTLLGS